MSLSQINLTTPEQVSLNYKISGLGSRATAQILDWLIIVVSGSALIFGSSLLLKIMPQSAAAVVSGYALAAALLVMFLLIWGYFLLFEFFASGRTPGKMLAGIQVMQENGQSLTFLSSAVRNLLRIIDFLPLLYLLGILMIFFHPRHKRVGDLAAGTIVVYQRRSKRARKQDRLETEMVQRLIANPVELELDEWTRKKFGSREWNILETYIKRRPALTITEQQMLARQVAAILFPVLGIEPAHQPLVQVENTLFALYMKLQEEWQYEELYDK